MTENEGRVRTRALPSLSLNRTFWIRLAAIAFFDALAISLLPTLVAAESWALFGGVVATIVLVNWAYLSPRAQASKWLTPGLIFMAIFVVYPVIYMFYVSTTNWATGNVLTKDQAIERLEDREIVTEGVSEFLDLSVYRNATSEIAFLVSGGERTPFFGLARSTDAEPLVDAALDTAGVTIDPASPPEAIGAFELLGPLQLTGIAAQLENLALDLPDGGEAQLETFSQVKVLEAGQRFFYDPETDTLFDAQENRTCVEGTGTFVCDGVPEEEVSGLALRNEDLGITCSGGLCNNVPLAEFDQSLPGWVAVIGFDQYARIITNEDIRAPFVQVFIWNIVFAAGSVLLTFVLGLTLANALTDERLKGRPIYRSMLIIPYAIPPFLTTLIWRGLLNEQFGQVNRMLENIGFDPIPWLGDPFWGKVGILLVNLWLGFPYMFLITSGALTSIPNELKEAARVDGASAYKVFRTVTLPLLLVSTAPLLIGSFAFNFNNFVLILFLTGGGPPLTGFDIPVGATDILVTFTFDLAARSGRGNQFGLAAAIVIVIFLIVALLSAISFRWTKRLEETYGN